MHKFGVPFNFNPESELYVKPNMCLIVALQPTEHPKKVILVVNTHILFNLNRGDIKLA